jgi:hypothetical protein
LYAHLRSATHSFISLLAFTYCCDCTVATAAGVQLLYTEQPSHEALVDTASAVVQALRAAQAAAASDRLIRNTLNNQLAALKQQVQHQQQQLQQWQWQCTQAAATVTPTRKCNDVHYQLASRS